MDTFVEISNNCLTKVNILSALVMLDNNVTNNRSCSSNPRSGQRKYNHASVGCTTVVASSMAYNVQNTVSMLAKHGLASEYIADMAAEYTPEAAF